jgi:adenylate cyclase class 2
VAQEIEAKFRIDEPSFLRDRLRELGARRTVQALETNRIFDAPDRRLLRADCGLRVREYRDECGDEPPRGTLTFKGPRESGETKSREELETAVTDAAAAASVLERLGFEEVIRYEKRREVWQLGECEVCLDELPRLGWFIEIEGPTVQAIESARRQLHLEDSPALRETYVELAAAHGETDATDRRRLLFSS